MLRQLFDDDSGNVCSAELMLIMTIMTIGTLVGMKSFRDSTATEFADFGQALSSLDQSYFLAAITVTLPNGSVYTTASSSFDDGPDFCDTTSDDDAGTSGSACVNVCASAQFENAGTVP